MNDQEFGDDNAQWREEELMKSFTYNDWYDKAYDAGLDWDNPNRLPPPEMLTEELCIAALQDAPEHLGKMPLHLRTAEVCFAAVYLDDDALAFVPEHLRGEVTARKDAITEAEWLDALAGYNGNHYIRLPERLLTADFCRRMVERNPMTRRLVRVVFDYEKDAAFWLDEIEKEYTVIAYLPSALQTPDFYLAAVRRDGKALQLVPWATLNLTERTTEELCLAAVQKSGFALHYVPFKAKTEAVCLAAVRQRGTSIIYVPPAPVTETLCREAVRQNGKALKYVLGLAGMGEVNLSPSAIEALCLDAVRQDKDALAYVPDALKAKVEAAVGAEDYHKDFTYNDWLSEAADGGIDWDNPPPPEMLTEELCIAALQDAPEHLGKMPPHLRSAEVCFAAVYIDDDALRFVPENLRAEIAARKDAITEEEWLDALASYNPNHYLKLPEKLLTPEFCRKMVERNPKTKKLSERNWNIDTD